jgi:hypothetical protein
MDQQSLQNARSDLMQKGLLAWQKPIYQILCLEPVAAGEKRCKGSVMSLGDILKQAMEEAQ